MIFNIQNNKIYKNIDNLDNLKKYQLLVHIDHGIGIYLGLKVIENNNILTEYLVLEYANKTKLYVPINSLHLVKKYKNTYNKNNVSIDTLGNDKWKKAKKKINLKIRDWAAELLDIYARRKVKLGYAFKLDKKKYKSFCKNFSFNVTNDQKLAIKEVLQDMMKLSCMDRVICGDVGFGKTEVAMRAAFLSVINNKQVAILTPTTLLARQHFENFKKRFYNFKFNIEMLSRFKSHKEEKKILKNLLLGKIDILIGTHKILQKNIIWYDLGLLIIDEEHKFGVDHKNIIKKIKSNIDILTLTATPIPRTLNMSMNGIKDLSIITTPPENRLSIKTFILKYNKTKIRQAILKEIDRYGQVYYIYNKVNNILKKTESLKILIPEARISMCHGQMNKIELEKIMNDFYMNKFDVLVCTTIIENGIDISNANTIIIEKSDQFGLAQLHQLRGRVGRANNQAYAWLFTSNDNMTKNAEKKLDAISKLDNLGAGFTLSMQDLEIRGAGEILGIEQSGQVDLIGFPMYMQMLKEAILYIKKGKIKNLNLKNTSIEINISAIIPHDFINNINKRIHFYNEISNAKSEKYLYKLKYDLTSKYGELPQEVNNLIYLKIIEIKSKKLGIKKIKKNKKNISILFDNIELINFNYLLYLIQKSPENWKIDQNKNQIFFYDKEVNNYNDKNLINWILNFIDKIKKDTVFQK